MSNERSNSSPFFEENLALTLKLESDGKEAELPSGNIEKISLNLHAYGFSCSLQFCTFDHDDVEQMFTGPKVIKATIAFKPTGPEQGTDPIIEFKGIITDKSFKRLPSHHGNEAQAHRLYEIYFCDNAKASWEQHYPSNIYVDDSMKDIIEKHVNSEISIKYDWDPLEIKHPSTAFSLEYKYWLQPYEQTNFYSFLIWYLHQENGLLIYNYKQHDYTITGKKKELEGKPLEVYEWHAMPPLCIFPQPPRYNGKVIKHTADSLDKEDKEHEDAFKSMRREAFDSNHYRVYPEHANQKIQSSLMPEKNEFELEFTHFTKDIQIDKLTPGLFLCFKGNQEGNWSQDACFKDKNFRIRSLYFEASKMNVSEHVHKPIQAFGIYMKARLEEEEEKFMEWPRFVPPHYPFYIQGKIFSDIGEKEQSTYKILESEQAPQGQYLVHVPFAGNEKKVVAPFVPAYSGQYYYPFCKDTRVMLAMHFRTAKVERPIDWDPLARLPGGIQGNQTVLASNGKDKYTIMRHEYLDGKDSIYTIKQSSSEEQSQTVQIKEKEMLITVDEKDKKTLLIQLNHESGLVLTLEDKQAGNTQQIAFDGTSMIHTCKGSAGTSTIHQKPDSIAIECKQFSIKSETILLDASDGITQNGTNKVDVKTKVANISAPTVKLGG